ncbi:MAG TPA: GPW/gp25 family protein [Sphingomonas sp.]
MDARTGKPLAGADHLRQSVADILFTPIGSRVALRDYGSDLPDLIDRPVTPALRLRIYAATAMALLRWEPRIRLLAVTLAAGAVPGAFVLSLDAQRLDVLAPAGAGTRVRLDVSYTSASLA